MGLLGLIKGVYHKKQLTDNLRKWASVMKKGADNVLMPGFFIREDVPQSYPRLIIGDNNIVAGSFIFESDKGEIIIGNDSYIGGSTFISRSRIEIGNHVTIAWGSTIYDHDSHSLDYMNRRQDITAELKDIIEGRNFIYNKDWSTVSSRPIVIKNDAWIGMNCIILKGVTIGEGAVVGAGSVVTHDVPDWTVVAGNPARVVKTLPH